MRRVAFLALAAFILLTPAVQQVFGHQTPWLRAWVMYSGVGVGILKGEFIVEGRAETLTPLAVLNLERYPMVRHYQFRHRVYEDGDIRGVAARYCEGLDGGESLSFRGAVGTRDGWRPVSVDDICSGSPVVAQHE